MSLAESKATIVVSSAALGRAVASRLHIPQKQMMAQTRNLGSDFTSGNTLHDEGKVGDSTRQIRLVGAKRRMHKVRRVLRQRKRTRVVWQHGIAPGTSFAAETFGYSPGALT